MTNEEALQIYHKTKILSSHLTKQLMDAGLIKGSEVLDLETPLGTKEYIPLSLAEKGVHKLKTLKQMDRAEIEALRKQSEKLAPGAERDKLIKQITRRNIEHHIKFKDLN